jgi:hypothetical protein
MSDIRLARYVALWRKGPFSVRRGTEYLTADGVWSDDVAQAARHPLWATADRLATQHGGKVGVLRDGLFDTGAWA